MKLTESMKAGLEFYTGRKVKSIKVHPDPKVEGTWAARAVMEDDGQVIDFYVVGSLLDTGRIETTGPGGIADAIEECQFDSWPPTPGPLRFAVRFS